jgi:hypothetical protein
VYTVSEQAYVLENDRRVRIGARQRGCQNRQTDRIASQPDMERSP